MLRSNLSIIHKFATWPTYEYGMNPHDARCLHTCTHPVLIVAWLVAGQPLGMAAHKRTEHGYTHQTARLRATKSGGSENIRTQ